LFAAAAFEHTSTHNEQPNKSFHRDRLFNSISFLEITPTAPHSCTAREFIQVQVLYGIESDKRRGVRRKLPHRDWSSVKIFPRVQRETGTWSYITFFASAGASVL
jgi:hypothetical protein